MKEWKKPQINNLSIEYTKNETDLIAEDPRGGVYCKCCEAVGDSYKAGDLGEQTQAQIESNLLAHKKNAHGYTGNNPYTKTCQIS